MLRGARELKRGWVKTAGLVAVLLFLTAPGPGTAAPAPRNFSDLAQRISPAVVNIRTVKTLTDGGRVFRHFRNPFGNEADPFKEFFDRFFGEESPHRDFKQRSLGSGFIIDKEGYIVTNNHVIEDADEIQVKLNDGDEFDAEIIGRDDSTDLALIKIDAERDLPVVKMGNSDDLKVGQWVLAIGSPFGLEHTVTAGIVSAKGRTIGSGPYDDFIQTDASINPGNSGGPLLSMAGEVVGINTAIVASGQGIGFAVPVNMARNVIQQLKRHGEVTRGWLGVAIQDLSPELAEYYGIDGEEAGVLVTEVFEGDPADKAGIRPEDVITSVGDRKISSTRELTRIIAGIGVGDRTQITLLRDGRRKTFTVEIGKREASRIAAHRFGGMKKKEDILGIEVAEITPDIARRFSLKADEGVVVTDIASGSKADKAGLMAGDLIKEINHQPIESIADYTRAIEKTERGEPLQFFIRRAERGFLVIKVTK